MDALMSSDVFTAPTATNDARVIEVNSSVSVPAENRGHPPPRRAAPLSAAPRRRTAAVTVLLLLPCCIPCCCPAASLLLKSPVEFLFSWWDDRINAIGFN